MKIVYISEGNIPSKFAHTFQAMKMAEALSELADSLTLVTSRPLFNSHWSRHELFEWYGIQREFKIARLPVRWRNPASAPLALDRKYARAAAMYARLHSPRFVFTRSWRSAKYCAMLGLRTILESHNSPNALPVVLGKIMFNPNLLGLVTVTDYLRDQFVRHGFPAAKTLVWPDGVDASRFEQMPTKSQARTELGLPMARPIVMYCGHFYESKGVVSLIEAARSMPDVLVCLVGGWPEDIERMRQMASELDNVRFFGFVSNSRVPRCLAAADVLVLPNSGRFEHAKATSPLKLFEYMAAKRPIVASDIPALRGVLRHQENCCLVTPDSPESLADGIRQILLNKQLAVRVADTAAEDVTNFTWKRRAAEVVHHFDAIRCRAAA